MAINLSKGQKINLKKDSGKSLDSFCVGLNWGAIEGKAFFGLMSTTSSVDLDGSCIQFDDEGNDFDCVYYGHLKSNDRSIAHSGDDLTGDIGGDDGLDNEVISVDLSIVNPNVTQIYFVLNSYKKQDFASIPYARIRMYEGTAKSVEKVFAKFDVSSEPQYAGHVSMIMGKLYKRNGEWKFHAIGEAIKDRDLDSTILRIKESYI
ncbi:TerD family protein [Aureibacter tunicatorum]|uniref:Tellurium resistance protein TerZ n=1 Tax=Aureibacter tunicatorum TaxID=866807 RepID=A0AAE3XR03_9BACT|nr:TerD family protein [Aureibacter tunicatorum]MDR6240404.1 tellurium resistance protein TerZ [Aureibacter tunicatorum]BDD05716.1 stress protein [Aureibacter tunicatorum]